MTIVTVRPIGYDALPKRFKDYIGQLESQLHALRSQLPQKEPTQIKLTNYHQTPDVYLPNGARIVFTIDRQDYEVFSSNDYRGLEVRGLHALAVLPAVSNVVYVVERKER